MILERLMNGINTILNFLLVFLQQRGACEYPATKIAHKYPHPPDLNFRNCEEFFLMAEVAIGSEYES